MSPPEHHIYLSDDEMEEAKLAAEIQGKTVDQAGTDATKATIARRFKRNTGKTPAKVYQMPPKKKPEDKK